MGRFSEISRTIFEKNYAILKEKYGKKKYRQKRQ